MLTTVVDGSLDTTTDLTFVGKNYSGYGTVVNQDLVKLLENFAGKLQPTKSLTGQLWYDSTNGRLKVNVGGYYKPVANIESQNTSPSNASKTDLWYNESTGKLNFYDGSAWVVIGPQISGATSDNLVEYASVTDDGGNSHNVLQARTTTTNGVGVISAIISPEEFVVNSASPLKSSFYTVKKGITLYGTSHTTGVGDGNYVMWGDASNSLRVGGKALSDLVLTATPVFNGAMTSYSDNGITINGKTRMRNVDSASYLENLGGGGIIFKVNLGGGDVAEAVSVGVSNGRPALLPGIDPRFANNIDIGSTTSKFGNIYAKTFTVENGALSVTSLSAESLTLTGLATVQNLAPVSSVSSDVGSSTVPFTNVYAKSVTSDAFHGPLLGSTAAPAGSGALGKAGSIAFDAGYVYICVATNTWKRAPLTTW